jgi:pyridoxal phosphate enzyme (YggS family)
MNIADNIKIINEKIERAAMRSGRSAKDITLIAVSKTVDIDSMRLAARCGIANFGENRVQELVSKYPLMENVNWHLIGHLQTNKVKYMADKVSLIHSVDSLKVAKEIDLRAKSKNKCQDILVEVNISGEPTKFGVGRENLTRLIEELQSLENIRVCGLMTIAPLGAGRDELKKLFENCNNLFIDFRGKKYHNVFMNILSMGMTNDFETAIECGANMIRIGTGIFGSRK